MNETAWFLADLDVNHIAVPYSWTGNKYIPQPHFGSDCYPAGHLRTSVSQLNNFLLMYMNNGEYKSETLLDSATVEVMLTSQIPFKPHIYYLSDQEQGIQWIKCSLNGRTIWGHPGTMIGSRTQMWFDPEKNIGVIILTNGEPKHSDLFEITKELFSFADAQIINNVPPNTPEITGSTSGKNEIEYEYTFITTDPNEDDISYCIDWGDDSEERYIGPFPSGEEQTISHTWSENGVYVIKVKAQDIYGAESEWATLEVSMPKVKTYNLQMLFHHSLENHPYLFPFLQRLISLQYRAY